MHAAVRKGNIVVFFFRETVPKVERRRAVEPNH
jgi:hypothetical protein